MARPVKSVTHRNFGAFISNRRDYPTDGRTVIRQNATTVDVKVFASKDDADEFRWADDKKHEGANFMTAKRFAPYIR